MTERPPMEINVRESAGVSVLEVHGRLTIGEPSDQLHAALQSVVQKGAKKVVVTSRRWCASRFSSPEKAACCAWSAALAASATPSPSPASSKPSPRSKPNPPP